MELAYNVDSTYLGGKFLLDLAHKLDEEFNHIDPKILHELIETDSLPNLEKQNDQKPDTRKAAKKLGRHGLEENELLYRLEKAMAAEELRKNDSKLTWKEIARKIEWKFGSGKDGVKNLEGARNRLSKLRKNDPDHLLDKIPNIAKEKKINQ